MSSLSLALITVLFSSFAPSSVLQSPSASASPSADPSVEAAESLGQKIIAILDAEKAPTRDRNAETSILVSEAELESFVMYSMEDEIPARVDSIDVTLYEGSIGALTQLTFEAQADSGNPIVNLLTRNPHTLFVRGDLEGSEGKGQFRLQQVRVDGIPVPLIVVDLLVERFVTPRFPKVDLDAQFQIPWGIEAITLAPGEARITY